MHIGTLPPTALAWCAVRPDPAVVHPGLLAGPRRPRPQGVLLPAVAVSLVGAESVLGVLGRDLGPLAPWALGGLLGGVAVTLLAMSHLPDRRTLRERLRSSTLAPVAVLLARALLLAACVTLAGTLLRAAPPGGPARSTTLLPLGLLAVVLATSRLSTGVRRRLLVAAAWCGLAATVVLVVVGALTGTVDAGARPPDLSGPGPVAALVSAGLGGILVHPLVTGPSTRGRRALLAAGGATGGVVAVVAVASAAAGATVATAPALLQLAQADRTVLTALGVVLAVVVLAAATTMPTDLPRLRPGWAPGPGAGDRAAGLAVVTAAATAVVLASGDVVRLVAGAAVAVLTHAVLTLLAARLLWRRALETRYQPSARRRAGRGIAMTTAGAVGAAVMLATAAVPGWPAALALGLGWVMMWGVSRHDRALRARLALDHADEDRPLPTVVRAFVVVTELDRSSVRAVAYARSLRASSLEALTVPADDAAAAALREQWAALELPVPLVELAAPPGRAAAAVVAYVAGAREPDGLAVVYLPEVTAPQRRRRALLRRGPHRVRERLLALPGTVVATVPWHLERS